MAGGQSGAWKTRLTYRRKLRQADTIFSALVANPEVLEQGRMYGLRFGISPLELCCWQTDTGKQVNAPPLSKAEPVPFF
jgi:hypothetical protein